MSFLARTSRIALPLAGAFSAIGLTMASSTQAISNESSKTFLGDDQWVDLKLKESWDASHNTKHFIFELPGSDHVSGLVTASCLLTKYITPKGSPVIRPYTPISDVNDKGQLELVIKKYDGGKMGTHIFDLKPNDTLAFKGPIVKWKWEPNQFKEITLIGGGTGITPLYQLLHTITKNPEDKTKVQLFYGNQAPSEILIKKEIDAIAKAHPDQVNVTYFVDKAESSDNWKGEVGYITKDFLQSKIPKASSDSKVFICGPPPFYKAISGVKVSPSDQGEVDGVLKDLGYTKENVFKF